MDGNKDEAIKCLEIAKNSIKSGDRTHALKFLNKARTLDPSMEIDEFLSKLNALQPEDKNTNETTNEKPLNPLWNGPRCRSSSEQVAVVREIKRKRNYYEILGLGKNSSAEDIRKAYRKLSLKVHPDKNRVPGAEDSFKKVSKAYECLSNEESRRKYDLETSPANKRVRVSETRSSSRSRSSGFPGIRPTGVSGSNRSWMEYTIIVVTFGVDAHVMFQFDPPWSMKVLMRIVRGGRTTNTFNLSGSFRLKYEYQSKMILLPKEDDLEADNELKTCIQRLKSLRVLPLPILVEFI